MEATKPSTNISGQYLTFNLKQRSFGVPIGSVREINRIGDITPVPKSPQCVAGVMNLRGKVIPVVDLRLKFGVEVSATSRETCIIVIDGDHGQIGMIVDAVNDVVALTDEQVEPPPSIGEDGETRFLLGIGKIETRVILLVDIIHALSKESLYSAA